MNGSFEMDLLSNGHSIRFVRKHDGPKPNVVRVCDNLKTLVKWKEGDEVCFVYESTPSSREKFYLWDVRTAGVAMAGQDKDLNETLKTRLEFWRKQTFKVVRNKGTAIVNVTIPYEFGERRLVMNVDTDRGFSPTLFYADSITNEKSTAPGKVQVSTDLTAKWQQVSGVWVPVHHLERIGPEKVVIQEYHVSWKWVNKPIDDREFTIDRLGIPEMVKRVYMEKGREVPNKVVLSSPEPSGMSRLIRFVAYGLAAFFALIWIAYRFWWGPKSARK